MKNIIKKTIVIIILSSCLYWLRNLILENNELQSVTELLTTITLPVIIITMIILTGIQTFLSYKIPALSEEQILGKIREYVFSKLTPEQMAIVDAMPDEDKGRFLEEMLKLQSPEAKAEMDAVMTQYRFSSEPSNLRLPKRLVKIALVALVLFSGYSVYQKVNPDYVRAIDAENARKNEIIADQVLYIEGLPPIQLLGDNEFKKVQIEAYIENNIKKQPAYLLRNASMIYLCNLRNLNLNAGDDEGRDFTRDSQLYLTLDDSSEGILTVSHELSHAYDFTNNSIIVSDSQGFQSLWQTYRWTFEFPIITEQEYCNDNSKEFFAESSNLYVNKPEYLKEQCPELYNYFASIYAQ